MTLYTRDFKELITGWTDSQVFSIEHDFTAITYTPSKK